MEDYDKALAGTAISVKLPKYPETKQRFVYWSVRIKGYIAMKELTELLEEDVDIPEDDEDLTATDTNTKNRRRLRAGNSAMVGVLMSLFNYCIKWVIIYSIFCSFKAE